MVKDRWLFEREYVAAEFESVYVDDGDLAAASVEAELRGDF